jgi:hypothetical protein
MCINLVTVIDLHHDARSENYKKKLQPLFAFTAKLIPPDVCLCVYIYVYVYIYI